MNTAFGKTGLFLFILMSLYLSPFTAYAQQPSPPEPIHWQPCYQQDNSRLLCAQYNVPLSYGYNPHNTKASNTISLALIKLPAGDTTQKPLGSLFVNPGGPGSSGVEFIRNVGPYLFTQEVRERYDLVGFDPRGINLSTPLTCDIDETLSQAISAQPAFPRGSTEEQERLRIDRRVNRQCAEHGNTIKDHMTTANVARDLDRLRQAVGDPVLHYVGYSYGSYLGVTYANLFPQYVGRMVVDGVPDPIQWSTGTGWHGWLTPVSQRLGSDKGSLDTLREFFRLCDLAGASECSFAGNSAARFDAIARQLQKQPLIIPLPNGISVELTYTVLISASLTSMYNSGYWPSFANLLVSLESLAPPHSIGQRFATLSLELNNAVVAPAVDNKIVGFYGVLCSDSTNPTTPQLWPLAAAFAEHENGYFGASWTWNSSRCAQWPNAKHERYTGPFHRHTKNPVLITSSLFDPATPYAGALTTARLLPNSRLVSVAGWGHTTAGLSSCMDTITANYLLRAELPEASTLCEQDNLPFVFADNTEVFAPLTANFAGHKRAKNFLSRTTNVSSERIRQAIVRGNQPRNN